MEESSQDKLQINGGQRKKMKRVVEESGVELDEEEPIEKILETCTKDELIYLVKEAVLQVPELIESVQRLADLNLADRNVFIHRLGRSLNRETLISAFSKYGEIEDCTVIFDKISGKSKGYGFILFKHRNGATRALKHPKKKINNRFTCCYLSSDRSVPVHKRKIFISDVSADIDPQKLTEFFAKYGEIEEGPLGLDKTGKFHGYCHFVYKSIASLKKALKEPRKNFEGKTLKCQELRNKRRNARKDERLPVKDEPYFPENETNSTSASGPNPDGPDHLLAPSGSALEFNPAVATPSLDSLIG